jgi:inorganic phosphate transporter, PiT family
LQVSRSLWDALAGLPLSNQIGFAVAMVVAFGFEFINGFHDTANAVTTVIYTRTLKPAYAVLYSGFLNFLGVMLGGTVVAFSIVNLLPVDLLIESASVRAIVMVVSLLLAGVIWNLATWWYGLPVSSSHTLIGSILGVGLANSLLTRGNVQGVNWSKAGEVGLSLLISPILGFVAAAGLLLAMKRLIREPRLYHPPDEGDTPPRWVRAVLLATCGGVSFAHGSNDGQKGMGLILLALIGFLPTHYALNFHDPSGAKGVREAAIAIRDILREQAPESLIPAIGSDLDDMIADLGGKTRFDDVPPADRWGVRQAIYRLRRDLSRAHVSQAVRDVIAPHAGQFDEAIEYAPTWVVGGVALALGIGTMVGYKRIVVTVAEKIGKAHMTYAQGAAAELVATATIGLADVVQMPVSTTHVLASGVAGTMWANRSGIQRETVRKIGLAWVLTLPAATALSAALFCVGGFLIPAARPHSVDALVPSSRPLENRTSRPLERIVGKGQVHQHNLKVLPVAQRVEVGIVADLAKIGESGIHRQAKGGHGALGQLVAERAILGRQLGLAGTDEGDAEGQVAGQVVVVVGEPLGEGLQGLGRPPERGEGLGRPAFLGSDPSDVVVSLRQVDPVVEDVGIVVDQLLKNRAGLLGRLPGPIEPSGRAEQIAQHVIRPGRGGLIRSHQGISAREALVDLDGLSDRAQRIVGAAVAPLVQAEIRQAHAPSVGIFPDLGMVADEDLIEVASPAIEVQGLRQEAVVDADDRQGRVTRGQLVAVVGIIREVGDQALADRDGAPVQLQGVPWPSVLVVEVAEVVQRVGQVLAVGFPGIGGDQVLVDIQGTLVGTERLLGMADIGLDQAQIVETGRQLVAERSILGLIPDQ